ncbi:hypothetical protein Syun_017108 [Stephania yunnanensis]|uniref:beta-N-acetylhexosaminidase n=1 Tax=Stephania yunnanensis TaxID=152371 RepID=A0AAP0J8L0_9MAGN
MARLSTLLIQLLCTIAILHSISNVHSHINLVWPKPRRLSWPHPKAALLSPTFNIHSPIPHPHLSAAVRRFNRLILTERHRPILAPNAALTASSMHSLTLSVTNPSAPLAHGADESYTLTVPLGGAAALVAETPWGAMRGLETFSQLVWGDPPRAAAGVVVEDGPLFSHRGLMLDTSRNYYGVEDLLRLIKGLSENKLNVFHWHITDSHSFPLVVPSEPELAGKGAYAAEMVYTPADVRRVVEFGLEHGVRVIPEIDTPGDVLHSNLSRYFPTCTA